MIKLTQTIAGHGNQSTIIRVTGHNVDKVNGACRAVYQKLCNTWDANSYLTYFTSAHRIFADRDHDDHPVYEAQIVNRERI